MLLSEVWNNFSYIFTLRKIYFQLMQVLTYGVTTQFISYVAERKKIILANLGC